VKIHLGSSDGKMIRDLNAIMEASNRNNEKAGITGALIFDTLWFVQILEGGREAGKRHAAADRAGERHDNLVVMDARPVDRRLFGNWWMGLSFLRGNHAALYRKHGIGERLNPRIMTGKQAVAPAQEPAAVGLQRQIESTTA
jgi:hypothetical protein